MISLKAFFAMTAVVGGGVGAIKISQHASDEEALDSDRFNQSDNGRAPVVGDTTLDTSTTEQESIEQETATINISQENILELQSQNTHLEIEIKELDESIKNLDLKIQEEEAKKSIKKDDEHKASTNLKTEKSSLETLINGAGELNQNLVDLQKALNTAISNQDASEKEFNKSEIDLTNLKTQNTKLTDFVSSSETQLKTKQCLAKDAYDEAETALTNHKNAINSKQEEINAKQKEIDVEQEKIDFADTSNPTNTTQKQEAAQQKASKEEEKSNLEQSQDDLKKVKKNLDDKTSRLTTDKESAKEKHAKLKKQKDEMDEMKKIIETTKASITTLEDKQKTQKSSLEICKQEIQEKHEAHKKAEQAIKDNDIKISEQRIKVQKKQSVFNFNTTELKELTISLSASEKSKVEQETQKEEKIKSKNELKTKIETEEKSISNSKEKISKILKKISYA